jgi:hypothetical protein
MAIKIPSWPSKTLSGSRQSGERSRGDASLGNYSEHGAITAAGFADLAFFGSMDRRDDGFGAAGITRNLQASLRC